jgi:hypothetical protein
MAREFADTSMSLVHPSRQMIDVEDHLASGSPMPADLYDCFLRSDRTPDAPAHHLGIRDSCHRGDCQAPPRRRSRTARLKAVSTRVD